MPFLFPPFRARERGARLSTARDKASAARRTSAKVQRGWMRTLIWIPREPLVLGQPRPHFFKKRLYLHRHLTHIAKFDARTRIQIHPQLIRMVQIAGPTGWG